VYDKLAKEILNILPKRASGQEPLPVEKSLENELRAVKTLDDLLEALITLEFVVSAKAALELSRYQWAVPFKNQPSRLPAIREQAMILYWAYRTVSEASRKVLTSAGGDLARTTAPAALSIVIGRIGVSDPDKHKGVAEFLAVVRDFIVLSLWVSSRREVGTQLITSLAEEPQAVMTVGIRYKRSPSSLLAYVPPGATGAHGKPVVVSQENSSLDLFDKTKPIDKGTGSPSDLGAPVWLSEDSDINALDVASKLFTRHLTVEDALQRILLGSASFGRGRQIFYTPVRIELMHELIHVLHNARGANREAVSMPEDAKAVWSNAEEYWVIAGGKMNENRFNAEAGLPERVGHSGVPLASLDPASPTAEVDSFATISGVP
jgi:hypothetical protein